MYEEISEALQEAEKDPKIVAFCITGNGPYYSSGNDLSNFSKFEGDPAAKIKEGCDFCGYYIHTITKAHYFCSFLCAFFQQGSLLVRLLVARSL